VQAATKAPALLPTTMRGFRFFSSKALIKPVCAKNPKNPELKDNVNGVE